MAASQYAAEMLCHATAADSGGRVSKNGNGVKKEGAGRVSPALMEEGAKSSASELISEPRTTRRAGGRGATVTGDLVILGYSLTAVLGNSCDFGCRVHLSFLQHNSVWNHLVTYGRKHQMHIHRGGKSEHDGVAFSQVSVVLFSGKIPGIQQELYLQMNTSETLTIPV